jgi:hypothetical protein
MDEWVSSLGLAKRLVGSFYKMVSCVNIGVVNSKSAYPA